MTRDDFLKTAKPILFSTPMVQALLEGRKTQTRRVIQPQPFEGIDGYWRAIRKGHHYDITAPFHDKNADGSYMKPWSSLQFIKRYARYQPGDILWVRETWLKNATSGITPYFYRADDNEPEVTAQIAALGYKWRPSIFMPREAARIFLRVTGVMLNRVQDISEADAKDEGIQSYWLHKEGGAGARDWHESNSAFIGTTDTFNTRKQAYRQLWDSLNAKRGFGWDNNPWVWAYRFKLVEVDDE